MDNQSAAVHAVTRIRNIEDPGIIQLLRDISTRWPAISAAADHPLLEFFIRRQGRPGFIAPLLEQLRKSFLLFLFMLPFLIQPAGSVFLNVILKHDLVNFWIAFMFVCVFSADLILYLVRKRRRIKFANAPENLVMNDKEKNTWIWLTGLTLSELAAIVFVYHYWMAHGLTRMRPWLYSLWLALTTAAIWYLGLHGQNPSLVLALIEFFPVGIIFIYYFTHSSTIAQRALWDLGFLIRSAAGFNLYGMINAFIISAIVYTFVLCQSSFIRIPIIAGLVFGIYKYHQFLDGHIVGQFTELGKNETAFTKALVPDYAEREKRFYER